MRKSVLGIIAIVFVATMMNPVHANGVFDQWGYNRTALVFKGWYVNAYAESQGFTTPYVGIKGDPCGNIDLYFLSDGVTCDPTSGWPSDPSKFWYAYNVLLEINVNRAWDDAHRSASWTPDAWLTNHQVGWYLGEDGKIHQWEWFLKIVWVGPGGSTSPYWRPGGYGSPPFYGRDEFEIIQSVYNDPYGGAHGLELLANPPGLGWG